MVHTGQFRIASPLFSPLHSTHSYWRLVVTRPLTMGTPLHQISILSKSHARYSRYYEPLLAPLRQSPVRLVEIGVQGGASLAAWRRFFPRVSG